MTRVLVLDAMQRSALSVTRSLGSKGIPVITADTSRTALAGTSRYSSRYYRYPCPQQESDSFVDRIKSILHEEDIRFVIPVTELTTRLLLRHRQQFPQVILPFPDAETVELVSNKNRLMRFAESLGVPVPATIYANNRDEVDSQLDALPYPLILKPEQSWLEQDDGWIHTRVRTAAGPQEARSILASDPAFRAHPFMLQEFIQGTGQGIFALYNLGSGITFFAHRRLREKPPQGGVSVLSESMVADPRLVSIARLLLDNAGWHGIAMVEFRISTDGRPYLMEINTRFWGSLQLAVDAGVDFPWLLYQMASGIIPTAPGNYRTGIRLRWLLGDIDSLYLKLRDRSYTLPDKLATMLSFMTPSPFRTRHEVDRWSDPGPAWWEFRQYLEDLFG